MNTLQQLSRALTALAIAHTAEEADDPTLEDDSVEITSPAANGQEISVQVAGECSPRGQANYSVSTFDGEVFTHLTASDTNDAESMAHSIAALIAKENS